MDLSETELRLPGKDSKLIEALASALDIAITVYDRRDILIAGSPEFRRFFDIDPDLLQPGARLRDLLAAAYDSGARVLGSMDGRTRNISRDDWIAERIAIHWRERYESVEQLHDGRWLRLCKRRMPDGLLVSTIVDVSEQKRRDHELSETRHQAELAQHILDNLANPVMVKDSALRYIIVNEAFCRIPGLHTKQVLGRTARELVEPDVANHFEAVEREVLETGIPYQTTEDIHRADGTIMHAVTHARRSGAPGNYFVTVSFDDVTHLVRNRAFEARDTWRYDLECTAAEEDEAAELSGRVLVLDANAPRGGRRAASLRAAGSDAVAISDAVEAVAFLDAARKSGARIDHIELCELMADLLVEIPDVGDYPELVAAMDRVSKQPRKKPQSITAAAPEVSGSGPSGAASPIIPSEPPSLATPKASQVDPEASGVETDAVTVPSTPAQGAAVPPAPTMDAVPDKAALPETSPKVPDTLADAPSAPLGANRDSKQVPSRLRVLVAEDNDVNQIVFEQILEGIGVDFRIVGNGQEAVAAWRAAPPDLILMDVSMPVMNGLQAAQAIRDAEAQSDGGDHHIPIIAVTAHAMSGDRERCFAAGMDDYLSKPVSPEKLEAIIRKWIDCSNAVLSV